MQEFYDDPVASDLERGTILGRLDRWISNAQTSIQTFQSTNMRQYALRRVHMYKCLEIYGVFIWKYEHITEGSFVM